MKAYAEVEGSPWICHGCHRTAIVTDKAREHLVVKGEGPDYRARGSALDLNIRCCSNPNWVEYTAYLTITVEDVLDWPDVEKEEAPAA